MKSKEKTYFKKSIDNKIYECLETAFMQIIGRVL
jgi:hypothetical protein